MSDWIGYLQDVVYPYNGFVELVVLAADRTEALTFPTVAKRYPIVVPLHDFEIKDLAEKLNDWITCNG